jgi:hypothetical protein
MLSVTMLLIPDFDVANGFHNPPELPLLTNGQLRL